MVVPAGMGNNVAMAFGIRAILAKHRPRRGGTGHARDAVVAAALILAGCGAEPEVAAPVPVAAEFVGGASCAGCHEDEAASFASSHHALAMQPATAASVLGDFDDAEYVYNNVTTRFFRRDGEFVVSTDGPDGEIAEFTVTHSFGVEPLQQYLVALGDGRWQALGLAWDARPANEGGQRWFHLYPDEQVDAADPLHWTGIYQNWNMMCADCHSTDLVKSYALDTDSFATNFSSVNVDCEACHGPSSLHAADPAVPPPVAGGEGHTWVFNPGESIASRRPAATHDGGVGFGGQVENCARCHSRRTQLGDDFVAGDALLDAYRPEFLSEGLYHADGQILDEVYVYGSFVQSAMARAGVVCSDCHDPHSTELKLEGNGVCAQCHLASVYDEPDHHRHEASTAAAECVSCHMRAETYMVVDPRRDHSFRVPRPDLSLELESPNACNDCHADESAEWAAARVAEWYPDGRANEPHFGQALHAARHYEADARERLIALIEDADQPGIARATAVRLLGGRMAPGDVDVIRRALDEDEPLLVLAAIESVADIAREQRVDLVQRFLTDDRLALRTAAARSLVTAQELLSPRRQGDLAAAITEYLGIQAFNSDRPEGMLNAGNLALDQGLYDDAELLYSTAIERYPFYAALYINLADLHRLRGRSTQAEATLRAGLAASPDQSGLRLALGFALVRQGSPAAALTEFRLAAELAPEEPYYQYVLAISENDSGATEEAIARLSATAEQYPGYREPLYALATMLRDAGEFEAAAGYAERLVALMPGDGDALALLRDLEQQL